MTLKEKLLNVQRDLKCNKSNLNKFGNYNYRSCEDILEAVKPLLAREKTLLTLKDEIVMVGDRFYVKATATLKDITTDEELNVSAYAREEESKKGMDGSQVTGACSSYARKYALNGLFCIDDTKDSDTDEYQKLQRQSQQAKTSTKQSEPTQHQEPVENPDLLTKKEFALIKQHKELIDFMQLLVGTHKYMDYGESDRKQITEEMRRKMKEINLAV